MPLHQGYDVVIVGAGPAGAFVAAGLAAGGLRVALVDRSAFPRDKVCGGGLSQKTLAMLPTSVRQACVPEVAGAIIAFANSRHLLKDMGGAAGAAVVRREFDLALLDLARRNGADFYPRSPFVSAEHAGGVWRCRAGSHRFAAPMLVGADGVFSEVRRQVFGRGLVEYEPAVEAYVSCDRREIDRFRNRLLFDFGGMPHGYGWIFPKADHLNVGVFSMFGSRSIRDDFTRFCALYPFLASASRVQRLGHAIPVRNRERVYARNNCLLVGDAGGFAEALYGEGIYFALKSADCAARAILGGEAGDAGREYRRLVRRELEPELRYSRRNATLFFSRPGAAYRLLAENQITSDWFAAVVHGRLSHRALFWRTLTGLPYWSLRGGATDALRDASWLTRPDAGGPVDPPSR